MNVGSKAINLKKSKSQSLIKRKDSFKTEAEHNVIEEHIFDFEKMIFEETQRILTKREFKKEAAIATLKPNYKQKSIEYSMILRKDSIVQRKEMPKFEKSYATSRRKETLFNTPAINKKKSTLPHSEFIKRFPVHMKKQMSATLTLDLSKKNKPVKLKVENGNMNRNKGEISDTQLVSLNLNESDFIKEARYFDRDSSFNTSRFA